MQVVPLHNTLLSPTISYMRREYAHQHASEAANITDPILSGEQDNGFEFNSALDHAKGQPDDLTQTQHAIQGTWTGVCIDESNLKIPYNGTLSIVIDSVVGGKVTGRGECYVSLLEVSGKIEEPKSPDSECSIEFKVLIGKAHVIYCEGSYVPDREVIHGTWHATDVVQIDDDGSDTELESHHGDFHMTRTPSCLFRYRRLLEDGQQDGTNFDRDIKIAKKRWAIALQCIRYQVSQQKKFEDRAFIPERLAERNRWIKLRYIMQENNYIPSWIKEEFGALTRQVDPAFARLFEQLAIYFYERKILEM